MGVPEPTSTKPWSSGVSARGSERRRHRVRSVVEQLFGSGAGRGRRLRLGRIGAGEGNRLFRPRNGFQPGGQRLQPRIVTQTGGVRRGEVRRRVRPQEQNRSGERAEAAPDPEGGPLDAERPSPPLHRGQEPRQGIGVAQRRDPGLGAQSPLRRANEWLEP